MTNADWLQGLLAGAPTPVAGDAAVGEPAADESSRRFDTEQLAERSEAALAHGGALQQAEPGFRQREPQRELARAVAQALARRDVLVAEAGTGVGKTFAYLVPLLLAGGKALVSTATKSLQDQLFLRDLPRLRAALNVPLRVALLKGRASYLCIERLGQARQLTSLADRQGWAQLARIERWAAATPTGDLAEVEGLDERSALIPLVTSTRDNCLGQECAHWAACHVNRARREAMQADLVVVNHHLFFADMTLRESGVAELLPRADAIVFDEAHQLVDAGLPFLGQTLATLQVGDLQRDVLAFGLAKARGLQDWQELAGRVDLAARELRLVFGKAEAPSPAAGAGRPMQRLRWEDWARSEPLQERLRQLDGALDGMAQALDAVVGSAPEVERLAERCRELRALTTPWSRPPASDRVRWIDLGARDVRLTESPLHLREAIRAQREAVSQAWIFTSATLGSEPTLKWFTQDLALEEARTLQLPSPFDYPAHARTWVPRWLPLPHDPAHPEAIGELAAKLAGRLGGRTFVLTTTLKVLPRIRDAILAASTAAGRPLNVWAQGSHPKRALLDRFLNTPDSVLVGSATFWEGIDVPGSALECVIIDKLPFPPPHDPLIRARAQAIERAGGDPFEALHLPEAAIALKQGAGRLIRSETDMGLLVIGDVRLRRKPYARKLRAALPPMGTLDTDDDAMAWIDLILAARATEG